ncbi:MAG TPA: hypothetical protein VKW06_09150 [Candidatus Angelobacter sp.]|nr:hypothetical protein [Candidatus Angelobacter sp.]
MPNSRILAVVAAMFFITCAVPSARAAEPPADLCSLLPAADVSKILSQAYGAPAKSVAPRPFAGTNTGTDCNYHSKSGGKLWFRAYVDPSPAASTELFARLRQFYGPPVAVPGLGDDAYFDRQHAIHVRKGKVRFYLNLSPVTSPTTIEKQIKELSAAVLKRL